MRRYDCRLGVGGPTPIGTALFYDVDVGERRVALVTGANAEAETVGLSGGPRFDIAVALVHEAPSAGVLRVFARGVAGHELEEAAAAAWALKAQGGWEETDAMVFFASVADVDAPSGTVGSGGAVVVFGAPGDPQRVDVRRDVGGGAWERLRQPAGAIVVVDIDWAMAFNDQYGHELGDLMFARVYACLLGVAPDTLRVGGEEFAVSFATEAAALEAAEAMRANVEAMRIPHQHAGVKTFGHVTVTVAVLPLIGVLLDPATLAERCRELMYEIRRGLGRNRVGTG